MSANTGRARSNSAALAEATNENGLVTTSSPSSTPTARSARCRPGRAAADRARVAAPRAARRKRARTPRAAARARAGRSAAPRSRRAPRPRRAPAARAGSARAPPDAASPRGQRARRRPRRLHPTRRSGRRPGCIPYSSESTSASQEAAIRFSETPIEPHTSWPSEASISTRVTAPVPLALVEDPDLEVDELDVPQVRVQLADRVAQRGVERVDRAVALGRAHEALAVRARP